MDTSAFVALLDHREGQHAAAKRLAKAQSRRGRRLVTTTHVFDEAITLVRRWMGHGAAVQLLAHRLHVICAHAQPRPDRRVHLRPAAAGFTPVP